LEIHFGVELLNAEWPHCVTCIGTFDGVHLGHQAVIIAAVEHAKQAELPCCLVTFDRHPAHILAPSRCPQPIASLSSNLAHFAVLGVSVAVILPFDAELSRTSASDFLQTILCDKIRTSELVVGHDFALGHGREGTPEWLAARVPTHVVAPFEIEGKRVSSSDIRLAVQEGRVEEAAKWLGRPFHIDGVVVGGQRLGRQLGYPTANLARSFDQVLPADGVYACYAMTSRGRYPAAVSVGLRPAVRGHSRTIEAYLIDYPGDPLYGYTMSLEFIHRLREERNYASLDRLKDAIRQDVQEATRLLVHA